jgi:GNAT superfamily N-acetyltransferase
MSDLLARFDAQVRRDIAAEPGIRVERTGRVVRIVGLWNCILYSELTSETADAAIAAQIEHYARLGRKFEWKLYAHDQPADLDEHLQEAGFKPQEQETLLAYDLRRGLPTVPAPPGVVFRRVDDAGGLADLSDVGLKAFGVDYSSMNAEFLARLPLRTVSLYVAYRGTQPVSAGRLELPPHAEFAGLYGGGTAPEHRRQGIYRRLVALRAREALARGYRFLNVEAAQASLPILTRLGFTALSTVRAWVWEAEA